MVRSAKAKLGIEAKVRGPAISTWPRVRSQNRSTSATNSRSRTPSQGKRPARPNWPRRPMAQAARTSGINLDYLETERLRSFVVGPPDDTNHCGMVTPIIGDFDCEINKGIAELRRGRRCASEYHEPA